MKITHIYNTYKIPTNLQQHMLRVASVGAWIVDHGKNKENLDRVAVTQALLLHDMGNIIKFDFTQMILSPEDSLRIEYLKEVQKQFTDKYGDEHTAAIQIAEELRLNKKAMACLLAVGSGKAGENLSNPDLNHKISCYSDFRVSPYGIVTVNERFDDIVKRYVGRTHELGRLEEIERRRTHCLALEKQIQDHLIDNLNVLNDTIIEEYLTEIQSTEIN